MEWRDKRTLGVLVEDDAGKGEGDVNQGRNTQRNHQRLLKPVRFLHAALRVRRVRMSDARAQTDKGHAHREADHAEHVGDLHVLARPEHGEVEAGLVVQDAVDNDDHHHGDQDVVAGLGSKRDGAASEVPSESTPHGAKEHDGVDAQGKQSRPKEHVIPEREVPVAPRQARDHLVEGNLRSTEGKVITW